jgi:beta-glucosidase
MTAFPMNPLASHLSLRSDFVWGTSTSAYQIEGAALLDGRGPSIWDTYCRQAGRVLNGDNGDIACDHYHRYPDDIALMQSLGIKAYRFSVAWPRVLPTGRGAVNAKGLDFYDRVIDACLQAGIEPWLCLYHWDLPQELDDVGGWTQRDCAGWFADYTALVARRYGDRVKRFATFNEPSVSTIFGYLMGTNAPGQTSPSAYLRAVHHFNLAHGESVRVIRQLVPDVLIGAVYTLQPVHACTPADHQAATFLDAHWNGAFAEPQHLGHYPASIASLFEGCQQAGDMAAICQKTDWIGVNHYSPLYARANASNPLGFALGDPPADSEKSAIGWPIDPAAFRDTLLQTARRYQLPIYVTENGYGGYDTRDPDGQIHDDNRVHYLQRYTHAMAEAIQQGADVRGYFVWSLLDNFEWSFGYSNRFGIVHVDFATQKRTLKASGHWYKWLIKNNTER